MPGKQASAEFAGVRVIILKTGEHERAVTVETALPLTVVGVGKQRFRWPVDKEQIQAVLAEYDTVDLEDSDDQLILLDALCEALNTKENKL
jgi:hypothetical protein